MDLSTWVLMVIWLSGPPGMETPGVELIPHFVTKDKCEESASRLKAKASEFGYTLFTECTDSDRRLWVAPEGVAHGTH